MYGAALPALARVTTAGAFIFDDPVPWFSIVWVDDGRMAVDFRLRIFVVDEGGNESAPFDIQVRDGGHAEGCGMAPTRGEPTAALGLLLLALAPCLRRAALARQGTGARLE